MLLSIAGEWAFVTTVSNRQTEERGFIPAVYCRRATSDEVDKNRRHSSPRAETKPVNKLLAVDSLQSSVRSSPVPPQFANPYHRLVRSPSAVPEEWSRVENSASPSPTRGNLQRTLSESPTRGQPLPGTSPELPYEAHVMYDFNVDGRESDEHIDCYRGDVVLVLSHQGDWLTVKKKSGKRGRLPACFTKPCLGETLTVLLCFLAEGKYVSTS